MNSEYAKPFHFRGGSHGCLLLHGFTGSPGHMRYIGENLRDQGYTVLAPLLPGHGATLEAMRASNWREWLLEAQQGYQRLRAECATVSVIGLSMGGALALILAAQLPVDSVVCLSAAIRTRQRGAWAAPLIAIVRPYSNWKDQGESAQTERPARPGFLNEYDWGYRGMPLSRVRDLRVLSRMAERNLFAVVAPALVVQPLCDESVDPKSAKIIMDGISSRDKELVWLEKSSHVCTLDLERELVLSSILKHLRHIDDINSLVQSAENHV